MGSGGTYASGPSYQNRLASGFIFTAAGFQGCIGYRSPEFWPVVFVACSHPVRICAPLTAFIVQPVFQMLGSPVVPFYPFSFWVPLLKPNSRKKGTLIIKGLLGNLERVIPKAVFSGVEGVSYRGLDSQNRLLGFL